MKLPADWSYKRLEDVVSRKKYAMVDGPFGSNLKSEHYKSEGVPVLQSGFVTSGKFSADKYVYVDQKLFDEQKRSAAKGGDILMAKIGAQAGRCAIIPHDHPEAIIAGNCLKLSFDDNDTEFFSFILYFNYERDGLSEIKTETAQPAISLKSLKAYKVPVPPPPEQKKIAKILSIWDKAITTTEQLLANSRQQKKALMQQLLTGKQRLLNKDGVRFSGEWKYFTFQDAFKVVNKKSAQVKSNEYLESGSVPIVDQGQKMIAGYCGNDEVYSDIPVIVFGDHTRCLKWIDFIFCPGADGTQVLDTQPNIFNKFGYYTLLNTDIPNLGYSRHMRELKEKEFKVPLDIEEQKKISAVLSIADREIDTLQQKLDALRQEKKALMQQLLTGKRRVLV
ncbi:restriction endonuclease subunit S [Zobellella endophytica]|uniref:Restriction endonuclease subunit S n=1 Tax=Zobellella endophytica TaxID=2116700 RepID=A0A2P7R4V4_9GAMM|nr:restriction endonuclease subunit S [Zobellella endophytica]PSJ45250.1 restriction endonuclease subunit S [Zobellella endophytica]